MLYFNIVAEIFLFRCQYWLDLEKPIQRQLGLSLVDPLLKFCVKFYTPDPAQIEEEYTRYLFCLQLKRDLMEGDLLCNDNTAALIISYIVQGETKKLFPLIYFKLQERVRNCRRCEIKSACYLFFFPSSNLRVAKIDLFFFFFNDVAFTFFKLFFSFSFSAECGDYTSEDYPDHTYLSSHRFVPHQDRELERKIMENHKKHV